MTKKVLGRGLSALLENAETDITGLEPKALHSIAEIQISQIIANPFQPRTEFDDEALEELSESYPGSRHHPTHYCKEGRL